MTDRHTADTITSDALDALYERVATAEQEADTAVAAAAHLTTLVGKRSERAEAAIEAVAEVLADHNGDEWSSHPATIAVGAAITMKPTPGPAATQATETGVDRQTAVVLAALHHSAEADVSRVIALYERWVKAGPPPLGTPIARWWDKRLVELHNAILPPTDQTKEG